MGLADVTEDSLYHGLKIKKPGERLSNISHAIQKFVEFVAFLSFACMPDMGMVKNYMKTQQYLNMDRLIKALALALQFDTRRVTNV